MYLKMKIAGIAEGLTHSKCAEAGLHRSVKWSEVVRVARLDTFPLRCSGSDHLWLKRNSPRPLRVENEKDELN